MKRLAIAAALLAASFTTQAKVTFDDVQLDNLNWAYNFGVQYDKMGQKLTHTSHEQELSPDSEKRMGYIMAAIAWQESSAGKNMSRKKNHHAYGLFQNYITTVRTKTKQMGVYFGDDHLKYMLEQRDSSGLWAMHELRYWLKQHKGNVRLALASYYAGWNTKAGAKYAAAVLRKEAYLKKHTLKNPNMM